ncbi:hypothetical protein [Streptomyces sp. SID2888]|uniref:hypothetical protein n=1 Tax=Streptomyces sp. SID2888 TaxID=2690256 RepID=UPI0013709BDA|nr:hypothetical protein [Streptomyces sp. SID2888]
MPADEVTHGADADASRGRTGPRHAAPRKPLFTRFHMPAGKAMALAAMPTAVFIGLGLNGLARADDHASATSLTVDEYQKCVEALGDSEDSAEASSSPSPSASATASPTADDQERVDTAPPAGADKAPEKVPDKAPDRTPGKSSGSSSSSDSGSDDKAAPTPPAPPSAPSAGTPGKGAEAPAPSTSAPTGGGGLLGGIGDALKNVLTPGGASQKAPEPAAPPAAESAEQETAKPPAQETAKETASKPAGEAVKNTAKDASSAVTDTAGKVTGAAGKAADTAGDTARGAADQAAGAASEATGTRDATAEAEPSDDPSPSADEDALAENCPRATDAEGGVEDTVALPDEPWHLEASSLLLKGARYEGIVKVRTADGTVKRVLKYVISDGTDIGDLHQIVAGQRGETYHVQAAKGSVSAIRDGRTVMYTESISGNLLGLIPVTFTPDKPPPLDIPVIYFTHVKVVQAGQFGGTLHVPGMHQYVTGGN